MGLRGYVRNLPDGRVEIVVLGSQEQVEQLAERVKAFKLVRVSKVTVEEVDVDLELEGFRIL
jgi:acylphosphatase